MVLSNTGTCYLCKEEVGYRTVTKHVEKCLKKDTDHQEAEKERIFLIKVYSGKEFWLYIEINGSSELEDLDYFLRNIWLECCHHMSQFKINGQRYSCDGGMNKVIHRILKVETEFEHEYDFGSTTWLKGKVIASRPGQLKNNIRLVARNHLPADIICETCDKKPDVICTECGDFICETCKEEHDSCSGEDFMLPVVNSPRMGVCGYSGPDF
ncbi:MAG: hypothetical protein A3F46_05430 [Legionellales bacterium RIFCSPHIGHO2_12_FULL_42_9]|nr:MAG: hypothetical protein A3F46_05430 [Legionellales bacterium RIFCSPHIGHO2_12_FULL_42_9]